MKFEEIKEIMSQLSETHEEYDKFYRSFKEYNKIIIMGNGGSNAIASHISQDYIKQCKKKSFAFSDPSMLTCFINDYGMENAYSKFLENFADKETLVILISSSGNSQNILNCAKFCLEKNINFGILTGFDVDNKLRNTYKSNALFDYYVNSHDYGVVECMHQVFLHGAS
jgi:D-sedoheptulose 7-phosphate isomerase